MEPEARGRVLYATVGPDEHGVTRHGAAARRTLQGLGADVEPLHATDSSDFLGLAGVLRDAVDDGRAVHLDVTDALFGPSPAAAADCLLEVLPPAVTLTLHDIPQAAEGEERFRRRAEAYARIARHVAGVVVSSEHERALLDDIVDVAVHVVPLPVEDRRAMLSDTQPELPEHLAGLEDDVVVFGFLYPGKGHAVALDALAELHRQWGPGSGAPRRVTALGPVSAGHDRLVRELRESARDRGLEFRATGFVPDELSDVALLAAGIPLAAHRNVSASGSLGSWMGVGRRPIVPSGRYVQEMARLRPGTLRVTGVDTGPLDYALAEAIAEAVEDHRRTWLAPGTSLEPGPETCARRLADVWATVHGWA